MIKLLIDITIRALLSLISLFIVTKIIGKKQISELSLFDYVIGISIGNFAAEMTINTESSKIGGILAVFIFGFIAYLVSLATTKSITLRRFFSGVPTIIIQDGKIVNENLKKNKMDINDLLEQLRINGYFKIEEIEYALLEANGKISVLPKFEYQNVIKKDLKIPYKKQGLSANIIIDGKIMPENLKNMNKTKEWLFKKIDEKEIKNILLATLDNNDKLTIFKTNNDLKIKDVLE